MKIKTWIVITAFVLAAAGCSKAPVPAKQPKASPSTIGSQADRTGTSSKMTTHTSSISTDDMHMSMSKQQAPIGGINWSDWFYLDNRFGNDAANRIAYPNQPQVQQPAYPQPQPQQPTVQTPAPNANPPVTGNAAQFAQEVLNIVNSERAKAGLGALTMNGALSNMAMDKAKDMYHNQYFDHISPTYGSPFDMMNRYGISFNSGGENIARGQRSPSEVMTQWMNSPGHRANILNGNFTQIGVAYYNGDWVQEFIG
ncbi:CAP domain-containing protein [Paenibacillus koleovorans]|uniref:CAP domain-containing protein n=1 Tax=Paenibacillus koleovorans TaxID=121608 RepID=UPI001FE4568D|nr:CAP domain-containing protein [Paenibacillus koleovorans]